MNGQWRGIAWTAALGAAIATGRVGAAVVPITLQPQPIPYEAGDPVSARTLVTRPPALEGVLSWTLESRHHRGAVGSLVVSPDGKQMATGGIDGTIRIWDTAGGQLQRVLVGHDWSVSSLDWSPCGNVIASAGSNDGTARLWDAKTGQPLRVFRKLKNPVGRVAWAPDGSRLMISGGHSGSLYLWTAATDQVSDYMEVGRPVYNVSWSPDGQRLALCVNEQPANVLDVSTAKAVYSLGLATDYTTHLAWAPDSATVATGSSDQVRIWALGKDEEAKKISGASYGLAFSPDGKRLAIARSSVIDVYDAGTVKAVAKIDFPANKVEWHKASGQLAAVADSSVAVWKWSADKPALAMRDDSGGVMPPVWNAGRPIVTGLGTTKIHVWDPITSKHRQTLAGHEGAVYAVTWSRDNRHLCSAAADRTVRLWDAKNGEAVGVLKGHTGAVSSIAYSPDGRTIASGSADKTVRLWDAEGQPKAVLEGHQRAVHVVAWAPMGNLVASGSSDQKAILWNPATKQQVRSLAASRPVYSIALASLGKALAVALGTSEDVTVYNGSTGELYPGFRRGRGTACHATMWMPSGPYLLTGRSYSIQLWDVPNNKTVTSCSATASVRYVSCAANGAMLVSGSEDRAVRFWDAAKGELRGAMLAEPDYLAFITIDGLWRADTEKEVDLVYVVHTREGQSLFTPAEFATKYRWKNNPTRVKVPTR